MQDNLVYKTEKSKVGTKLVSLRLLSLFIALITGLLFCATQKVLVPVKTYTYDYMFVFV